MPANATNLASIVEEYLKAFPTWAACAPPGARLASSRRTPRSPTWSTPSARRSGRRSSVSSSLPTRVRDIQTSDSTPPGRCSVAHIEPGKCRSAALSKSKRPVTTHG